MRYVACLTAGEPTPAEPIYTYQRLTFDNRVVLLETFREFQQYGPIGFNTETREGGAAKDLKR